jgi:MFS transporter, DHA3 family, macrolide efflux protein
MSKFSEILKNRNFLLIWIGQIISQWGDRLGQVAVIAFVYERNPGSAMDMAKILSFTIIPVFLVGPIAGVYVDRWDRRRTMFLSDIINAILIFLVPMYFMNLDSNIPLYIVIFLVFCIGRFFVPAKLAIIPDLVKEKDLLLANSLVNITGMIAAILGFGLGGILVEWWTSQSGFYLDAWSFLISAVFIFFIKPKKSTSLKPKDIALESRKFVKEFSKSVLEELKEGVKYLFKLKDVRFTTGILFLLWSALGAVYVVFIVFIQQSLQSATKDLGLLIMFLGLGLFLGTVIYGRFGQKIPYEKAIFGCLSLSGLSLILFVGLVNRFPNFIVASSLSVLIGLVVSPIMNISNTLVHEASTKEMRGKVFSSLEIVIHLAFLISMFASSFIAERVGPMPVMVTVGLILTVFGFYNIIKRTYYVKAA